MRNIVITGLSVITPVARGKEEFWNALSEGRSSFSEINIFDTSNFNVHIAGEIKDFDVSTYLGKLGLRDMDRSTKLICSASKLALDDAKLIVTDENTHDTAICIGTIFGSLESVATFDRVSLIEGPRFVNPSHFPNTVINSPASRTGIFLKIRGFNTTISIGACSGLDAITYACDFIKLNRISTVIAGGVEELSEDIFRCFYVLEYLSGIDGTPPLLCPFDKKRNGFILSEGACALIIESEEHAIKRGATILARILGYASVFDYDNSMDYRSSGKGLKMAITMALQESRANPEEIDFISASANSSPELDRMETLVIKEVFGKRAYDIPVTAIKSIVGETYSASGAISVAGAIGFIQKGFIPPIINYTDKDPECDLYYVTKKSEYRNIKKVIVLSSDPFGHNTAMVIGI